MTNQQILEKAIQKAIDGGWKQPDPTVVWWRSSEGITREAYGLIFNHDFAKALWGDELIQYPEGDTYTVTALLNPTPNFCRSTELFVWQYHLQQMVIAEDPIKYLGEHLDD